MREMNARQVTIMMSNGTVFKGMVNIGSCRRISDFFRKQENHVIVVFEATPDQNGQRKVYFLNWNHIVWIEPNEPLDETSTSSSINLGNDVELS